MTTPSTDFPSCKIDRLARRLDAIVQYHHAGVGYAQEHERLLRVTIMETQAFLDDLRTTATERNVQSGRVSP